VIWTPLSVMRFHALSAFPGIYFRSDSYVLATEWGCHHLAGAHHWEKQDDRI
jgi:hypothetical protein